MTTIRERHQLDRIERKLDAILRGEVYILEDLQIMATDLSEITQRVTETRDAEDAAVLLLGDLKSRLDSAGTDPVALKALSDQLGSGKEALASAIVANTPAAVEPTPVPEPTPPLSPDVPDGAQT